MKSVTIAMPSMGTIKTFTLISLINMMAKDKTPKAFSFPCHTYVHEARRISVEEARANGTSHILFIDSDMVFQPDALERLASHRKMVVGANYNERQLPLRSTVKFRENGVTIPKPADEIPKHLFKCFAVPTGMMLIDLRVFDQIKKPWFFFTQHEDGRMDFGEDVYFCNLVQEAGMDVWCDPSIDVRHIGDYGF